MALAKWSIVICLVASACGSSTTPDASAAPPSTSVVSLSNDGGSMEGHTPRGFAGSGTGMFAGDNLNPGFPVDDGVQLWLSFELPAGGATPSRALLSSDVMTIAGTPFEDLGTLLAEPVTYESFGPQLFDLAADGPAVDCRRVGAERIECDVTDAVTSALESGSQNAQFRLRFERVADGDGSQDRALFFLSDSNLNEPGIFHLDLS
ncbi:MAG: hypothetical protein QNM02_07245 [Acidimicrobiia bacterium]|nr:hypothetical protein [Acidimicrobiia bacterium]